MLPYIKIYGKEKTRLTVVEAIYLATGMEGRSHFHAPKIRQYALDIINRRGEHGTISSRMVNRMLASVNREVFEEEMNGHKGYKLKPIRMMETASPNFLDV